MNDVELIVWSEPERCKNCRFWSPNVEPDGSDDEPRTAQSGPSLPRNGKACTNPKVGGGSYSDDEHDADDAANSYETFITGPLFGCVHFSPCAPSTPQASTSARAD